MFSLRESLSAVLLWSSSRSAPLGINISTLKDACPRSCPPRSVAAGSIRRRRARDRAQRHRVGAVHDRRGEAGVCRREPGDGGPVQRLQRRRKVSRTAPAPPPLPAHALAHSTAYGVEISDSSLDESFALEGKLDGGVGEIAKCAASLPPLVHAARPLSGSERAGVPQGREQDGRRHCQAEEQRRTESGGRRGLVPVDSRGRPTGARAWLPASM